MDLFLKGFFCLKELRRRSPLWLGFLLLSAIMKFSIMLRIYLSFFLPPLLPVLVAIASTLFRGTRAKYSCGKPRLCFHMPSSFPRSLAVECATFCSEISWNSGFSTGDLVPAGSAYDVILIGCEGLGVFDGWGSRPCCN